VPRIVIAGGGAVGASIAYHLGLRGADGVVLADRGEIAGGSTAKAFGGVRQQFSTAAEVMLARESLRLFEELGPPLFERVGYLFLATSEDALSELAARSEVQEALGVPVELVDRARVEALVPGLRTDDVLGGVFCAEDGTADPAAVARELVRRAVALGVEVRERTPAEELDADVLVVACGAWSAELAATRGVELPVRPLVRQLVLTTPVSGLPSRIPVTIESETGFHFRRRDGSLVLAMGEAEPRWGFDERVAELLVGDWLGRLARRFPPAAAAGVERAWAGLYDMTPDAHAIVDRVAEGLVVACGFSGHGFMQSPAVGRAVAELVLDGGSSLDLGPYRLDRFAAGTAFPESVVL
jgi:sarcosine oxidase subunit beta